MSFFDQIVLQRRNGTGYAIERALHETGDDKPMAPASTRFTPPVFLRPAR